MIDFASLWTEILASLIVAAITALIGWLIGRSRSKRKSDSGNTLILEEGAKTGDITQSHHDYHIDQRTVIEAINVKSPLEVTADEKLKPKSIPQHGQTQRQSDDTIWLQVIGVVVVVSILGGLFLLATTWFLIMTSGIAIGLAILAGVNSVYLKTHFTKWQSNATATLVIVTLALAGHITAWLGVFTLERDDLSILNLGEKFVVKTDESAGTPLETGLGYTLGLIEAFIAQGGDAIGFIVCLLLSIVVATALLIMAFVDTLRWSAFLRFADGRPHRTLVSRLAAKFVASNYAGSIVAAVIMVALVVGLSQGYVFDFFVSRLNTIPGNE